MKQKKWGKIKIMQFSVLMSVYNGEKPSYLHRSLQSIWDEQNLKPNEIILVEDGQLTEALTDVVAHWQTKLGKLISVVFLEQNVGLGNALSIGLDNCSYEVVARMDSDDIADPYRFEKQIDFLKENPDIDIVGSWVGEFDNDENSMISYRESPEYHNEIIHFSKKRNPMNHPTVMYKKSMVEKASGYKKMILFEDYYLWIRMILAGAKFHNIQEPLVNMRAGYGQLERRSGFSYAMSEFTFQKELLTIGFINSYEFLRNTIIRFTARVVPKSMVKIIYKRLRK